MKVMRMSKSLSSGIYYPESFFYPLVKSCNVINTQNYVKSIIFQPEKYEMTPDFFICTSSMKKSMIAGTHATVSN